MAAQTIKGVRLSAPNDNTTWTDTSVNIGTVTGPVSFFAVFAVGGGASSVPVVSCTINGNAMTLEADRSMNDPTDVSTAGRWRAARLDAAAVSGALTIVTTKSTNAGRTNLVLFWSDEATGVTNISFVPYATGGTSPYAYSATVASSTASQAIFAGLFNASISVTATAPTAIPNHSGADASGLLVGSSDFRLVGLAEQGASTSVLQATLQHAFSAGGAGWVANFAGSGGVPGPVISVHPAPQTVVDGGVANFSVTAAATGGGALAYQWRKGGVAIAGATSASYARTVVLGDSGSTFTCAVTESGGSNNGTTVSSGALLTVTPIVVGPGFTGLCGPLGIAGVPVPAGQVVYWSLFLGAPGAMTPSVQGAVPTNAEGKFLIASASSGLAMVVCSLEAPGVINTNKPLFTQFVTMA